MHFVRAEEQWEEMIKEARTDMMGSTSLAILEGTTLRRRQFPVAARARMRYFCISRLVRGGLPRCSSSVVIILHCVLYRSHRIVRTV